MATSGSCETSKYNNKKWVRFDWIRENYVNDATTCRSGIYFELYGVGTDNSWHYSGPINVWINRTSADGNPDFTFWTNRSKLYNGTFIGSERFNIDHDINGDASFSVYIEAAIYSGSANCYGAETWTLDSLPRKATINTWGTNEVNKSVSIDGNSSVGYTSYSSDFYYRLRISIPNVVAIKHINGYANNQTITFTTAEKNTLYSYMPTTDTITLGAVVETYTNSSMTTKIGESEELLATAYITNAEPTFSNFNYADIKTESTTLTGDNQIVIDNYNQISITVPVDNKAIGNKRSINIKI